MSIALELSCLFSEFFNEMCQRQNGCIMAADEYIVAGVNNKFPIHI